LGDKEISLTDEPIVIEKAAATAICPLYETKVARPMSKGSFPGRSSYTTFCRELVTGLFSSSNTTFAVGLTPSASQDWIDFIDVFKEFKVDSVKCTLIYPPYNSGTNKPVIGIVAYDPTSASISLTAAPAWNLANSQLRVYWNSNMPNKGWEYRIPRVHPLMSGGVCPSEWNPTSSVASLGWGALIVQAFVYDSLAAIGAVNVQCFLEYKVTFRNRY